MKRSGVGNAFRQSDAKSALYTATCVKDCCPRFSIMEQIIAGLARGRHRVCSEKKRRPGMKKGPEGPFVCVAAMDQ
jgi:hypothetical protein